MEDEITKLKHTASDEEISRGRLAERLKEDLSREYQAIIAYVVYSQVLTGAAYGTLASAPTIVFAQAAINLLVR